MSPFRPRARERVRGAIPIVFLSILPLLWGCATQSDARFFAHAVDDRRKAELLVEKGIELYESELVKAEKYDMRGEIRRYFETALRYDPENKTASRYVESLDGFVEKTVQKKIALAGSLAKKPNRTEDESLQLCAAIAGASQLDPANDEIPGLREASEPTCGALAASYTEKAQALRSSVVEGDDSEKAEKTYLLALDYCRKVLLIDPENRKARAEKNALQDELEPFYDRRKAGIERNISEGKYDQANKDLAFLRSLDAKLDDRFQKETRALSYSLYYNWAKKSLSQKRYQSAGDLADRAVAVDRTPEALALKREIAARRRALEEGADFDAFLEYVDSLIDQNRLGDANRSVAGMLARTKDPGRLKQLEQRKARVRGLLPDLYREGVDAYKQESFQKAVRTLEIVVDIDPDYEQAASYLEKARSKQRLLESL